MKPLTEATDEDLAELMVFYGYISLIIEHRYKGLKPFISHRVTTTLKQQADKIKQEQKERTIKKFYGN